MQNNLITIDEIISRAKKSGTFLGHGDPKVHLAYLTKIRLLPQAVRRKVGNKISGCYPDFVPSLLQKIEEMRAKGLTYSQIRFQFSANFQNQDSGYKVQDKKQETGIRKIASNFQIPSSLLESGILNPASRSNGLAFLLIGLVLGYLLAHNNSSSNLVATAQATPVTAITADTGSQPIVKSVENGNASSDSIYLIAIPKQNLYKLGQTNINTFSIENGK